MLVEDEVLQDEYYRALMNRDPAYQGVYVVGVRSTGIFCISTCGAKKPKRENCTFYTEARDALRDGYRPCKMCRPLNTLHDPPEAVRTALHLLADEEFQLRISDWELEQRGLSPAFLRRWFKSKYGITFQGYQRMLRVNRAFEQLQSNSKVSEAAMDSGYDSLSGFGYSYQRIMKSPPSRASRHTRIIMDRFETPIGAMFVATTDTGICLLEFTDRRMLERELGELQKIFSAAIVYGTHRIIKLARSQMEEYFAGSRYRFDLPLDTPGSDFRISVWNQLKKIPYGQTSSYGQMAAAIGKPKAQRAVGAANGENRVAIVIPCHRVIGGDGTLVGYGGGLDRKKWLLEHEAKHLPNLYANEFMGEN